MGILLFVIITGPCAAPVASVSTPRVPIMCMLALWSLAVAATDESSCATPRQPWSSANAAEHFVRSAEAAATASASSAVALGHNRRLNAAARTGGGGESHHAATLLLGVALGFAAARLRC